MDEQIVETQETQQITPEVTQVTEPTLTKSQLRAQENMTMLRKRLDAEEEARKNAERRAQELEQRYQNVIPQPVNAPQAVEEDELLVDNEDYVQAKHVKTTNKKLKSELAQANKRLEDLDRKMAYFEAKLDTDALKDFEQVVSDDNLKTLARLYPDDYNTVMQNPNLKAKSKTAYNMIKNYGIYNTEVDHEATTARIVANHQKPKSAAVISPQAPQTPLTRLDEYGRRIMSEEDAAAIMRNVRRKLGDF